MGGNLGISQLYPSNISTRYDKDISISYETIETIIGLRPGGQAYNLSIIPNLISGLKFKFPEHQFLDQSNNLYKIQRSTYLGELSYCCTHKDIYYDSNGKYYTCDPTTKIPGINRNCDYSVSNYCFSSLVYDESSKLPICTQWLDGYIRSKGYDNLISYGYNFCTNYDTPFCNHYLTTMRNNPNPSLHDAFIEKIKDNTFRCSYPLDITLERAKTINIERVCWDPKCIASPLWKLKYSDYVKRLNCNLIQTSINVVLSDAKFISALTINDDGIELPKPADVNQGENIYTNPLKQVGRIQIDFLSVRHLLGLSILCMLIAVK